MIRQFDSAQMFLGFDYQVNDNIYIHQPTIGEILKMGEKEYFNTIYTMCAIPSDMKAQLFDANIDYELISDFELFILLLDGLNPEKVSLVLPTINIRNLKLDKNEENGEVFLYDEEQNIVIDRIVYQIIIDYIRALHGIVPKIEKAANKYTKKILIEESRMKMKLNEKKNYTPMLQPILISCMCTEEFKYTSDTVRNIGINELLESFKQIQHKKNALALLQGSYSGMIDTSKINKKEFSWVQDTSEK